MSPPAHLEAADSLFLVTPEDEALLIPPPPDAFEVIGELVAHFKGRVWIISKAGPRIQRLTLRWLSQHHFHERTAIPESSVLFCLERKQKFEHARKLGLTHFIDDRVDVLNHLSQVVPHRFLFGQRNQVPDGTIHVPDWNSVRNAILKSGTS